MRDPREDATPASSSAAHPVGVMAVTEQQRRTTRRVTLNVDEQHLREAGEALGTASMTETINRSLEEVVRAHHRMWLAEHRFEDLTLEALREMRRPRFP